MERPQFLRPSTTSITATLVFLLTASCRPHAPGPSTTAIARKPATNAQGQSPPPNEQNAAESLWAARSDEESLLQSLSAFEALAAATPDDPQPWLRIAEGRCLLGRLHTIEHRDQDKAREAFAQGLSAARAAQEHSAGGEASLQQQADYWAANNLLEWTLQADYLERVDHEQELLATLQRLSKIAESAHGPQRALAQLLAMPAGLVNRDLAASKALFQAILAADPWDLHTRARYAATYAIAAQDREVFEQQLKEIVERTSSNHGDPLERRLAARTANNLLRQAANLFE